MPVQYEEKESPQREKPRCTQKSTQKSTQRSRERRENTQKKRIHLLCASYINTQKGMEMANNGRPVCGIPLVWCSVWKMVD